MGKRSNKPPSNSGNGKDDGAPSAKRHNKKNVKLAKKQAFKKGKGKFKINRQKLRQIKLDKDELRKLGMIGKEFNDKVGCHEVHETRRLIGKLVKHVGSKESAKEELPDMFGLIDDGDTVDLRHLQDAYVQHKLFKICKLLHLPHLKSNELAFKKRMKGSELHNQFKLKKLISHFIDKAELSEDENDDDLCEDDSDSDSSDNSFCSIENKNKRNKKTKVKAESSEDEVKKQPQRRDDKMELDYIKSHTVSKKKKVDSASYSRHLQMEGDSSSSEEEESKIHDKKPNFLQQTMQMIRTDLTKEKKVNIGIDLDKLFASKSKKN